MPLDYGQLVDHINNTFRGGPQTGQVNFWQRLEDIEFHADQWLQATGKPSTDRFEVPLRDLPRDVRQARIAERADVLGVDQLFGPTLEGSPAFRVRKAPTMSEQGYGSFVLPREAFIRGVGAESAEDIAAKLSYVTPTVQMERSGIGPGAYDFNLSGSTPRKAFIDDAARQAFDADKLRRGTRLVFDVETAGLETDKGIWQLSARLMRGDTEVDNINLMFRNNMMDLGLYGTDSAGRGLTFEQFYQQLRGGGPIDWIDADNFAPQMQRFLGMATEADYLVGQNTAFDVRMLLHGMEGRIKSSPEFEEAVQAFTRQIDQGKVVDTRMFSKMLLGDIDIAQELQRIDKFTPHSMENILLQTSFLEDLAGDLDARGLAGWDEIRGRITQGMHHGDIDTWFEDHLFRMQTEVLSGQRPDILANASLADADLRRLISQSAAVTPFTRVEGLGGAGVDMTPIEFLAQHERKWGMSVRGEATSAQLREGGVFRNWAEGLLTKDGTLRKSGRLVDSGFGAVQARAMDQGLPFAGISSFERLISTVMGQHAAKAAPKGMNAIRNLMGDLTGSAAIQRTDKAAIHGGRNVALPMELIMAAEQATDVTTQQRVLSSNFSGALGDGVSELQTARWSAFTWGDGQRDVALVADIVSGQDDVDRMIRFMEGLGSEELKRYGVTPAQLTEYSDVLSRHGQRYGVQIGIMGGKDNHSVSAVANLLDQMGFDVDSKGPRLRTAVFGVDQADDFIFTTASMVDSGDTFAQHADEILENTRLTRDMASRMLDSDLDPNITRAVTLGKGDPTRANRIYSFLEANMPHMPRRLGYAGAAIAGYYLFNKVRGRSEINETMAPQEYERHDFYERYRAEMGEELPQGYGIRPSEHALATAGLVGNLDKEKLGHHRMGPGKHGHLFGG